MEKETWFSATKALEYGFADHIAGETENKSSFLFSNKALGDDVYARICAKYEPKDEPAPEPEADDTHPSTGTEPAVTDAGGTKASELYARLDAIGRMINV